MSSKPELSHLRNSLPTQNQLVDALTSHISLYHSQSQSRSPYSNPNPRSSILKWFASLSVHRRGSHLTAVDAGFVRVLVQMLSTRRARGHGRFIVLSDILSGDLPSVCFKSSSGLLARVSESDQSERAIFESTRLFSSQEEAECSSSSSFSSGNCLDSITVIEEFVENFDRFVGVMDGVSDGRFLRGEESEMGSDWVELEWLKDKGYYSIEAFVANRIEVALRLAWLNQCSGNVKKKGARLKEKLAAAAGVAANVYWRKKGCVDWWDNLDSATKNKLFISALGKSAKNLTGQILKAVNNASEDELGLYITGDKQPLRCSCNVNTRKRFSTLGTDAEFGSNVVPPSASGKSANLSNALNSLIVLRDIVKMTFLCQDSECDNEKIFFSSLSSICTISDFILRKVRGLLMVISLDSTKLELIAEESVSSSPIKPKGKSGASSRKKKGRARSTKKLDPVSGGCGELLNSSVKAIDCTINYEQRELKPKETTKVPQGTDISKTSSLKEPANVENVGKTQSAPRKMRKGKGKKRVNELRDPGEVMNCKRSVTEASNSVISQDKTSSPLSVNLSFQNESSENSVKSTALVSSSSSSSAKGLPVTGNIQDAEVAESFQSNKSIPSILGKPSCVVNGNAVSFSAHVLDGNSAGNGYTNIEKPKLIREPDLKSSSSEKQVRVFDIKEKNVLIQEQDGRCLSDTTPSSSSHGPPYEWPSVASTYFSPRYPHLPHATDRLHLDVSRNWHHHFPQTLIPAIHQRNIEGACSPLLARQLPMSVDWPPMVRSVCGLAPSRTCNYESGFVPRWHYTYPQEFSNCNMPVNSVSADEERKNSVDFVDSPDLTNKHELQEDWDSQWLSEDEMDIHEVDYNQYFGGGVMYWDPSDRPMGGFSRPPSLSSDDSSWAWREADMNRAVDDMVAFSSPYSTNGLTSPTAAFCSPFDTLGPGHQAMGYVMTGSEIQAKILHTPTTLTDALSEEDTSRSLTDLTGEVEGKARDSLPYNVLPPIIIPNITRDRSRSEFKRGHDVKSPCLPLSRSEHPRVKRPPSPVMRCVTRGPRPPPPSPVSDSRKHRGFPTVRSGSSSPRHWGMRGWFHDGANLEEACLYRDGAEIVWPSWRSNNFSGNSIIQPLPPALLQDRLIAISHLARDQEHPDVALPMQPAELQSCPTRKASLSTMHTLLHDEIEAFCKKVAAQNLARKPYITWAVKRVTRSLQVLWPRSRTNIFGSNLTGLALPTSDVDLVVCLPPVRNLEPIKEAGILEGRNGIKETCLQHAARYLANQDWVKIDSLKTVENTAIPIIMLAVEVPRDLIASSSSNVQSPKEEPSHDQGSTAHSDLVVLEESALPKSTPINSDSPKDSISVRLDISFKSPSHTGLQTTELVKKLTEQFPAAVPLAMVLKQFLSDRSLDQSYSGGLSSYCLILLVIRFLQHQHHLGRSINQNYGSLLIDFLYFFGNVFDPRQMRTSVRGSGIYIKRERGCSIDPIHIDDPLFPTNNVGRNCFRIHQCIKAFSEAYVILENECANFAGDKETSSDVSPKLLPKIIPSIGISQE